MDIYGSALVALSGPYGIIQAIYQDNRFSPLAGRVCKKKERLGRVSILVYTLSRMLQRMDQTTAFELINLRVLVLDKVDRILDMSFQNTIKYY